MRIVLASLIWIVTVPCGPRSASADSGWSFGLGGHPPRDALVSLHSAELQPITHGLALRIDEASVKDRQLWIVGEIHNRSNVRYEQVRLVVSLDHGADQRLTVGRLLPRTSRRIQARLTTDFAHAPPALRVTVTEARTDHRPQPYRWQ
jgi:hypothetical protein